jgi:hypothetical protein
MRGMGRVAAYARSLRAGTMTVASPSLDGASDTQSCGDASPAHSSVVANSPSPPYIKPEPTTSAMETVCARVSAACVRVCVRARGRACLCVLACVSVRAFTSAQGLVRTCKRMLTRTAHGCSRAQLTNESPYFVLPAGMLPIGACAKKRRLEDEAPTAPTSVLFGLGPLMVYTTGHLMTDLLRLSNGRPEAA